MNKILLCLILMAATSGMFAAVAVAEDRDMICSCWLTAYDYGMKGMGSETAEYRSGYNWCDNNGFQSGGAWIDGWQSGYDNRNGGLYVPRDCEYYFANH